ncbi:MAG: hypothetical protein E6Q97_20175 [Desulfurellales bacterium]|nr:MAG: hypothetical protein E6Q97_20175 [Desulfurellales bacterium]
MNALHTATIRGRREALGLTQKQAAKLARVTEPTWQRFEAGEKPGILPHLVTRCMRVLNGEVTKSDPKPRGRRIRKPPTEIRIWRDTRGITQATAAELAGVNQQTWHRFEVGEKLDSYLAKRCARVVSGETPIPADVPKRRTEKERGALAKNRHRYTSEEAQQAGRKGGQAAARVPNRMAELGRKGGAQTQRRRREQNA